MAEPLDRYDAELTTPEMVILEMDATDKLDAAAQLAERMHAAGRISDLEGFLKHVNAREHQLATGLPGGIGLPHARSEFVSRTSIAVGITKYGKALDFGAADGPATVVLLIAHPGQLLLRPPRSARHPGPLAVEGIVPRVAPPRLRPRSDRGTHQLQPGLLRPLEIQAALPAAPVSLFYTRTKYG